MDELEQNEENEEDSRPSVKELVARIQQQQQAGESNPGENSESSDDEDSPLRMVQQRGPMGSSNMVYTPDPNPNYENVPNGVPRSRMGVYSPTSMNLVDSNTRYIEPIVRIQESSVRVNPNSRIYTSSARIPVGFDETEVRTYEQNPKYYEQNVNMRFAKLRMLDNTKVFEGGKSEHDGGSRTLDSNKMFESTARMLEHPHDAIDRDTNNDSGYSTKVYGSSKGNSPCLSGQTDNECLGASSLV